MTKTGESVSIALHHGVNAEHRLYRLKRGTLLRLVPGPSLLGRNVALYCNYPVTGGSVRFIHFISFISFPKNSRLFLFSCVSRKSGIHS